MNTSEGTALPRACFDTSIFPAAERFDMWRAAIEPLATAHLAPGVTSEQFFFRSEFVQLGQTQLGGTWQRGIGVYRATGTRELRDAPEVFFLQTYLKGGFYGYYGSHALTVATGDVVLLDAYQTMHTWVHGDEEILSLAIPRQMLMSQLEGRFAPVHLVLPAESASAVLLRQNLINAWEQLPRLGTEEAGKVEAMLVGALASLLRLSEAPPPPEEAASLAVIRAYIDDNLHDPALDADALCQRFRCSRASLYRLFAPLDGVAGYIRQQRLERCHADLQAARPGDTAARIALRWGFGSEHHFSRRYRNAFGVTPGATLARSRPEKTA